MILKIEYNKDLYRLNGDEVSCFEESRKTSGEIAVIILHNGIFAQGDKIPEVPTRAVLGVEATDTIFDGFVKPGIYACGSVTIVVETECSSGIGPEDYTHHFQSISIKAATVDALKSVYLSLREGKLKPQTEFCGHGKETMQPKDFVLAGTDSILPGGIGDQP